MTIDNQRAHFAAQIPVPVIEVTLSYGMVYVGLCSVLISSMCHYKESHLQVVSHIVANNGCCPRLSNY